MSLEIYNDLTINSPFGFNIIPEEDIKRISELRKYNILNSKAEVSFDSIAEVAAQACQAPIGLISFIDINTVFFKSAHNSPKYKQKTSDRGDTLCSLVVRNGELTTFLDTHDDPCLMANAEVRAKNGVRFYAGVPIRTKTGFDIGALAVVDTKPRKSFTKGEANVLFKMASIVLDELELRLALNNLERSYTNNLAYTSHELINPINTIVGLSQLIKDKPIDSETNSYLGLIEQSAQDMNNLLNRMLKAEKGEFIDILKEPTNLSSLLSSSVLEKRVLANNKSQQIKVDIVPNLMGNADPIRIKEVFDNLIDNAIKYSPINTGIISISAHLKNKEISIKIEDNGLGFNESDKEFLFQKFVTLSSLPTGNEKSNGLGMYITKQIIDKHEGQILLTSAGKDQGTSITILLKAIE